MGSQFFCWKTTWKAKIPTKVAFFVWSAARGSILTPTHAMIDCNLLSYFSIRDPISPPKPNPKSSKTHVVQT